MTKVEFVNYLLDIDKYRTARVEYTSILPKEDGFRIRSADPYNIVKYISVWNMNLYDCSMNSGLREYKKFISYDDVVAFMEQYLNVKGMKEGMK